MTAFVLATANPDKAREIYRRALAMDDDNVEGLRRKLARLETGS